MEGKLNINEIVVIEQLPQIFYQLEKVGEYLDEELNKTKDLVVSEDSKQEVKKVRTNINNVLKQFEDKRKEVKTKCLEAYTLFEEKYNSEVKIKLQNASEDLKVKIDSIEKEQLREKSDELELFANEHIKANHLENILDLDRVVKLANLKINLSTSLKSLKEDSKTFIEKVANEVKLIELEEKYNDEILLEYQNNGLDFTRAKLDVITKHKQLEELAKQREDIKEVVKQEEKIVEQVEEIVAPKEVVEEQEVITVTFTITDTKENIIKVREFMKELGVKYE